MKKDIISHAHIQAVNRLVSKSGNRECVPKGGHVRSVGIDGENHEKLRKNLLKCITWGTLLILEIFLIMTVYIVWVKTHNTLSINEFIQSK